MIFMSTLALRCVNLRKQNCENWWPFIWMVTPFCNLMVRADILRCGECDARNGVGVSFTKLRIQYLIAGEHQMLQIKSSTAHSNFPLRKSFIFYWRNSLRLTRNSLKLSSNLCMSGLNTETLITPERRTFLFRVIPRIELSIGSYCEGEAVCLYGVGTESLNLN